MGTDYKRTLQRNLRRILYDKDISAADLSRAIGVPKSTVSNWMNGISTPRSDKIDRICELLHISPSDLVGVDENGKEKPIIVRVLGKVAAGIPLEMIQDESDPEELDPEKFDPSYDYYGLIIRGDSMEPRIKDGDIVIFRKQSNAESGQLVIATVNGEYATCKRLIKTDNGIGLLSYNQAYDPMFFTNADIKGLPVTIIGVVVELRARFI